MIPISTRAYNFSLVNVFVISIIHQQAQGTNESKTSFRPQISYLTSFSNVHKSIFSIVIGFYKKYQVFTILKSFLSHMLSSISFNVLNISRYSYLSLLSIKISFWERPILRYKYQITPSRSFFPNNFIRINKIFE